MTSNEPVTVPELFRSTVARCGDQPALGTISHGKLLWKSWSELDADVRRLAKLLLVHRVQPGDRIVQISANRYEWIVVDLAILSISAVHVPMHMSLSTAQLTEQITDSGAKVVFLSAEAQAKLQGHLDVPLTIFCHDAMPATDDNVQVNAAVPVAEDLATLIYTSGTTGKPRGVMLSHRNLTFNAIAVTEAVGSGADETRLCFLPLSHIYARTCDLYSWLYRGSRLVLAESRETIVRDCQIAKPGVINGVPYFYQKVAQQLQNAQPDALKTLLGGCLKRCFCGGAAVAPEVEALFARQGLPILAGYGLTETSPVITATALENYQPGTVGKPIDEVEVRLAKNGEICIQGPNVMLGYWNDPETTEKTIVDGWLKTGDLGKWDAGGNLRIVGRAKEMIVLSTGKNVSPMRVEQLLTSSAFVESVCVVGEGRKCLAALIVPNPDALRTYIRERRLWVWSRRRAVTHPRVLEFYREEIDRLLADASQEEQVGPFAILKRNFSQEQGELTAKLSLRRETITTNFAARIEKLYW